MADGELTLKLDEDTARRLQAAADAAGRSVDDYAVRLIADGLAAGDDGEVDLRIADEYDRTGVSYSVEEAETKFRAELMSRVVKGR